VDIAENFADVAIPVPEKEHDPFLCFDCFKDKQDKLKTAKLREAQARIDYYKNRLFKFDGTWSEDEESDMDIEKGALDTKEKITKYRDETVALRTDLDKQKGSGVITAM